MELCSYIHLATATVKPVYSGHLWAMKEWPLQGGGLFMEVISGLFIERWPSYRVATIEKFLNFTVMFFYLQFNEILSFEANKTLAIYYPNAFLKVNFYPNIYYAVSVLLVLLSLPIINYVIIPCFPKLTIRARIGVGLTLYCIGNIAVVAIHTAALVHNHWRQVSKIQLFCLLLPMIIFAVAESLTVVASKHNYAQIHTIMYTLSNATGAMLIMLYQIECHF